MKRNIEEWKENIIANYFDFGTGLGDGIQNIEIDLESKIIDELVEAAKPEQRSKIPYSGKVIIYCYSPPGIPFLDK